MTAAANVDDDDEEDGAAVVQKSNLLLKLSDKPSIYLSILLGMQVCPIPPLSSLLGMLTRHLLTLISLHQHYITMLGGTVTYPYLLTMKVLIS